MIFCNFEIIFPSFKGKYNNLIRNGIRFSKGVKSKITFFTFYLTLLSGKNDTLHLAVFLAMPFNIYIFDTLVHFTLKEISVSDTHSLFFKVIH